MEKDFKDEALRKKEEFKAKAEEAKVRFFSKQSTRVGMLIIVLIVIPMVVSTIISVSETSRAMEQTYLNYSLNLAEASAQAVDFVKKYGENTYGNYAKNLAENTVKGVSFAQAFGEEVYKNYALDLAEAAVNDIQLARASGIEITSETLGRMLSRVTITGVEGSYAYMVDANGTMLYHPTESKIGNPVTNAAVKQIVADLRAGKTVENGSIFYDYNGAIKLAGYALTARNEVVIITADYEQFMKIDWDTLIGEVEISGVEGSYAYMVSADGTMLYHTNETKIGQPVENAAVKQIVADIAAGKKLSSGYTLYEYKGALKLAGYDFLKDNSIIVVTADYDKFMVIDWDTLIGALKIDGVEGSYAYMVGRDGTMLYHKDSSKIGGKVENQAVTDIVASLKDANTVGKNCAVTYMYKGAKKIAGCAFLDGGLGDIIVVTADYNTMMKPVHDLRTKLIVTSGIFTVLAAIIGYVIVSLMLKSFERLVPVIKKTAHLDFRYNEESDKLCKRMDETGVIARELAGMRDNLKSMVSRITDAGSAITSGIDELQSSTARVSGLCTDNSATSEELAAGMQETSATTAEITNNIVTMQNGAAEIENMSVDGVKVSEEIMGRASGLKKTTEDATKRTINIYESVKVKSESAIEASKAVSKINELTETIMAISSQTSLLALNASIEAARAGEAGRGFAVVANEIGNLATQTSNAVSNINGIVGEVNNAVAQMQACLGETTEFLEKNVLEDYKSFGTVSDRYRDDAGLFKESMLHISDSIEELNKSINVIVDAINGINVTINESADGVTNIAQKTSDMVGETNTTSDQVDVCRRNVAELESITQEFKLD